MIETPRHRLVGSLTVPAAGFRSRLLDFLNASDRDFLALTDVTVERLDAAEPPHRREFVAVARRQIVLATPAAEPDEG